MSEIEQTIINVKEKDMETSQDREICCCCPHELCPTCTACHNMDCVEFEEPVKPCFNILKQPKENSLAREEAPLQGDSECFEVPSWQTSFKHEFGIHFSPSELQFATEFIRTEIEKTKEEMEANLEESAWAKAFSLMERTELLHELSKEWRAITENVLDEMFPKINKTKGNPPRGAVLMYRAKVLALIDAHLVSNK